VAYGNYFFDNRRASIGISCIISTREKPLGSAQLNHIIFIKLISPLKLFEPKINIIFFIHFLLKM